MYGKRTQGTYKTLRPVGRLVIVTDRKMKESYYYHLPWICNISRTDSGAQPGQSTTNQTYIWIDNNIEESVMKKILKYIFIMFCLTGCSTEESDVAGIYVKEPSINTIDSIFIYADSIQPAEVHNRREYKYKQRYYDKKTGKLLFENINTWYLDGCYINFMNLYLDIIGDEDPTEHSYSNAALENALTPCRLPIEDGQIIVNYDLQVRYVKVK